MNNSKSKFLFWTKNITSLFLLVLVVSCEKKFDAKSLSCSSFSIQNFNPLVNWQTDSSFSKNIFLDYNNSMSGFIIPSVVQTESGKFSFVFELKNTTNTAQKFYYKLYYQNEDYKFPEYDSISKKESPFAEENFYGSWENTSTLFKETSIIPSDNDYHTIKDEFRIVGNPRNEERFFSDGKNDRWKRNPRVGKYSFLLIVSTEADLQKIPKEVQNINLKLNDHYISPYSFFLFNEGARLKNSVVYTSNTTLNVVAKPNLGAGIYINDKVFNNAEYDKSFFCETCGQDSNLLKNAPIQQFINYVDESTKMDNIPVIADILKDNYSKMDYNWNKSFYKKEELIPTIIQTAKHPCQTVFSDPKDQKIIIKNPGTKFGEWKKESVGIITRHGFTYGKYLIKARLTELLNKNGVWNGLTNAIWLITQGGGDWNYRRNCNKEGYMATYWGGPNDKRVKAVDYSEIDFEILKTPPYCPDNLFPPIYKNPIDNSKNINSWNIALPEEIINNDDKITVACTNWDMACQEPDKFSVGCTSLEYQDKTFYTHRWDHSYRALTEKQQENDDELFSGEFYYFEIDWRPTEIIWRIGPDPKKLKVVGYMNDHVSSIPNNQMLLIITQEYHNTKWWPGTPYSQDNLPFPANDIPGEIYEITIE
jgi:hypothetical protein